MTRASNAESTQLHSMKLQQEKERKREQNRIHQQHSRAKRRALEVLHGKRDAFTGRPTRPASLKPPLSQQTLHLPNLTHSTNRLRKSGKYKEKERVKSDWKSGTTWAEIDEAARLQDFKAHAIVRYLRSKHAVKGTFDSLYPGTVQKWIQPGEKRWRVRVIESVRNGSSWCPGKGRIKLLAQHPGKFRMYPRPLMDILTSLLIDVLNSIRTCLLGMRVSKLPVNSQIAHHVCYGFVSEMAPELLQEPFNGMVPKLSTR